jgi:tetratricopeptide (TPR) repeat protein
VVLSLGVAVGLGLALSAGGRRAVDDERLALLEDLEARRMALMEQIRTLGADRDKLGEAEFAVRREGLVSQAAAVLAELERVESTPAEVVAVERAVASSTTGRRTSPLVAGLWASTVLMFFGVLAVFLTTSSSERAEGGSMTGGSGGRQAAILAEVEDAKARLEADEDDLEAIHIVTYHALLNRDLDNAMKYVDQARALDPDSAELHVHLAILQLAVGMHDRAETELDLAVAARPEWGRPYLWMGLVRLYQSRPEDAITEVEKAIGLGLRADEQQFARQLLSDARNPKAAAAQGASGAAAAGGSAPPSGPMYAGAGGGAVQLAGQVSKPDGDIPADQVVFLVVYRTASGSAPPPPVATARLTVADLPFAFQFEEGHSMTGGPWPEQVWVKARIDGDGRPGASPSGDLDSNLLGPVSSGSEGLVLTFPSP